MARASNERLLFFVVISLAALALQAQRPATTPSRERARQVNKSFEKAMEQDRMQPPAPQTPDWQKAQADADRLLFLAQLIHQQVHAGPGQIPAGLAGELKEIQKLSKGIHYKLRL